MESPPPCERMLTGVALYLVYCNVRQETGSSLPGTLILQIMLTPLLLPPPLLVISSGWKMLVNIVCFSLVLLLIHPSDLELIVTSLEELDSDLVTREARLLETLETQTDCETRKEVQQIYQVIIIMEERRVKTNITLGNTI